MDTTSIVFLDIALDDPTLEDAFFAWWTEAKSLLAERAKPVRLELLVAARGRYSILLETHFAGAFNLVAKDRPWQELDARRPRGTLTPRELRIWHDGEGTRDISTTTLRAWLAERERGQRDFVLADALGAESFAEKHIPGSVSLPVATLDAEAAARVIGPKDRRVVIYCGSYG
jgi:hypothetical protein